MRFGYTDAGTREYPMTTDPPHPDSGPSPSASPRGRIRHALIDHPLLVSFFVALLFFRIIYIVGFVSIHNDERHYALDGLWVKAKLPASRIARDLLYNHARPHPFYNPRTAELGYHGRIEKGYQGEADDLGPYPRAGHPCLYMLGLGAVYSFLPEGWLVEKDHCVQVARAVNILLDTLSILFLFNLLRRCFGKRIAYTVAIPFALWPFTIIFGSLAYLDAPGTFFAVLSAWYYVARVRSNPAPWPWAVLGVLAAMSFLIKQSDLILLPILAGIAVLVPYQFGFLKSFRHSLCALACFALTVCAFCNPVGLLAEIHHSNDPAMGPRFTLEEARRNLLLPFTPQIHYHVGHALPWFRRLAGGPWMSPWYEFTTPAFFALFWAACLFLVLRGSLRSLVLVGTLAVYMTIVRMDLIIRRLHILMPFAAFVIAAALWQLRRLPSKGGTYPSVGA
jgi:hypothetical protein